VGLITLLALLASCVFAFAILRWKKAFNKRWWAITIIFALLFSLFLAYVSVSSVWVPHALSDNVFYQQNVHGEYGGMFPWSQLSYPACLSVYHTPFETLTFGGDYAYGQVRFTIAFAGANVAQINGTFWYFYPIYGPSLLQYNIDFLFHDSVQFFGYLLALYTIFNFIGALVGIGLAYALHRQCMWK
jgi:hypothetical protein